MQLFKFYHNLKEYEQKQQQLTCCLCYLYILSQLQVHSLWSLGFVVHLFVNLFVGALVDGLNTWKKRKLGEHPDAEIPLNDPLDRCQSGRESSSVCDHVCGLMKLDNTSRRWTDLESRSVPNAVR